MYRGSSGHDLSFAVLETKLSCKRNTENRIQRIFQVVLKIISVDSDEIFEHVLCEKIRFLKKAMVSSKEALKISLGRIFRLIRSLNIKW